MLHPPDAPASHPPALPRRAPLDAGSVEIGWLCGLSSAIKTRSIVLNSSQASVDLIEDLMVSPEGIVLARNEPHASCGVKVSGRANSRLGEHW
jgi:hypothetical protein